MENTKLDDLPGSSDDKFWGGSDVRTGIVPQKMFDDDHYFKRVSGHEGYCDHCGWGFALDPGDKIKDGHVYTREDLLVI